MKKYKVVFKCLRPGLLGTCNYRKRVITIDLKQDIHSPIYVYLHEMYHLLNPVMLEDEVTARAWLQYHKMTQQERLKFYRKLFRRRGDG